MEVNTTNGFLFSLYPGVIECVRDAANRDANMGMYGLATLALFSRNIIYTSSAVAVTATLSDGGVSVLATSVAVGSVATGTLAAKSLLNSVSRFIPTLNQ